MLYTPEDAILAAKQHLDWERLKGDDLSIQLAEIGLNDLLDKYAKVSIVTENGEQSK